MAKKKKWEETMESLKRLDPQLPWKGDTGLLQKAFPWADDVTLQWAAYATDLLSARLADVLNQKYSPGQLTLDAQLDFQDSVKKAVIDHLQSFISQIRDDDLEGQAPKRVRITEGGTRPGLIPVGQLIGRTANPVG
jgi:hypothetical protein